MSDLQVTGEATAGRFPALGHELAYEVRGQGRPLVLLHGLAVDRRVVAEACEPCVGGWRRIYIDLPGHGGSAGNPEHASADELVAVLAALIRELATDEPPALVGYSYGGYLAQGLVRELELSGLFLACPTVEPDFGKRVVPPRRVALREEELPFSDDPREREAFEEVAVIQTRAALEIFQRVVHPANIATDQALLAATRARYVQSLPFYHALQAFDRPVGIVCARDDHWVGFEDALRLVRAFRRVSYAVLPDCGHLLPLEAPAQFRALLSDWLSRI
jgi:pimeloyl-ACP methyl ester carboxylesterase